MATLTYQPRIALSDVISVTPTLDTLAYVTGDRLGSVQTITDAVRITTGTSVLQSITILDQARQSALMDILFFRASPTVASADNAAIDITDAQMLANYIGSVSITESYVALAGSSVVTKTGIGLVLKGSSSHIYALPIIRGSGTYAANSLVFMYGFLQD